MPRPIEDGEINLRLLLGTPGEAQSPLDFYASGIYAIQQMFPAEGSSAPKWFMQSLDSIGSAYAGTTESWVKEKTAESLTGLIAGGTQELPAWGCSWEVLNDIWTKGAGTLMAPISHCVRTMCEHRTEIPSPVYAKCIIGILLGDIGAAIYRARMGGSSEGFERELKSGLGRKATIKDLLDLYYMFGLCAAVLRAGHKVDVMGTASQPGGGPDFQFTCSSHGQQYYVEANRKEPLRNQMEKNVVWAAIDEKAAKVAPENTGQRHKRWEPCLLSIDITSLDLPGTKEDLDGGLVSRGPCGEYVYRAFDDPAFNARIKSCADALGAAAIRVASLRKRGYGIAGVLLTRNQYLQINATGIAQAEGAVLVLHKDFEAHIPACIARHIYLVDDSCVPQEMC